MKKICFSIGMYCSISIFGQVGVNTTTPEATLDVRAKNHFGAVTAMDGILVPRVSDLVLGGSVNGQLVYLIADNGILSKGFYYWDGSGWKSLIGDPTNDSWINDPNNNMIKLAGLSDFSSRPAGKEFVVADNGNVAVGTVNPSADAILELNSANKGILIPRVSLTSYNDQVTISGPSTGLLVFNTGTGLLKYKGFVFWNGTEWRSLNNTTTVDPTIVKVNCTNASAYPQLFVNGVQYNGNLTVSYEGGNGGSYQNGAPFTQNGLTFTLNPGTLNNGNGTITYSISGVPNFSSPSTIQVPVNFLGSTCNASIGNISDGFEIGQIKSLRVRVPINQFTANGGSRKIKNGKYISQVTTTDRQSVYELSSTNIQSQFINVNGLRMDFLESTVDGNVSPKFFNTTSFPINYSISSLSTNSNYTNGDNSYLESQTYSFSVDGNDELICNLDSSGYTATMLTFPDGSWYNCKWSATRDGDFYYFYFMTQRLN
jgi:hypothetical protein